MDGAGTIRIFFLIILPLLRPAVATLAVLLGLFFWTDLVPPLIILGPLSGNTISTGIYRAIGQFSTDWGTAFAWLWLACVPIIVVFLWVQRFLIGGLTDGATRAEGNGAHRTGYRLNPTFRDDYIAHHQAVCRKR